MWEHGAVDLFRLLCLLWYSALPTQAQCDGQSYIDNWGDVQRVLFKCDYSQNYYYYICGENGWGDEEATVVCREQGYTHGSGGSRGPLPNTNGLTHVECNGDESNLQECVSDLHTEPCSHVGVITQCYSSLEVMPSSCLMVSEGDSAHFCVSLKGILREVVQVLIETRDEDAVANHDYIPVSYTLRFGPSLQSEQCRDIQIINDSLAEGLEMFTVQLTTDSIAVELTTPQIMIHIQRIDAQLDSCEDGNLNLASGVNESSLQLVEMCSEGVWSPVCDHNWTIADATVVCRELGMAQDDVIAEMLPSQGLCPKAHTIDCEGSEIKLADCVVEKDTVAICHYVLVHCGTTAADSQAERSSAGAVVGGVMAVLVAVVLVVVVVVMAVLVFIQWKANTKLCDKSAAAVDPNHYEFEEGYTRPTGGQQHCSPQPAVERREGSVQDFELVNPVYGIGVDQPVPPATTGTPEHNLINPLYANPSSQGGAEPVTGQEYATVETPRIHAGGSNGVNEYENEERPPHT